MLTAHVQTRPNIAGTCRSSWQAADQVWILAHSRVDRGVLNRTYRLHAYVQLHAVAADTIEALLCNVEDIPIRSAAGVSRKHDGCM